MIELHKRDLKVQKFSFLLIMGTCAFLFHRNATNRLEKLVKELDKEVRVKPALLFSRPGRKAEEQSSLCSRSRR